MAAAAKPPRNAACQTARQQHATCMPKTCMRVYWQSDTGLSIMRHAGACQQIASQDELHAVCNNVYILQNHEPHSISDIGFSTGRLIAKLAERLAAYDPPHVLLLVDMQYGFVTPASPDPFDGDPPTTLRRLHAVAERCEAIAASGLFDRTICTAYRNTKGCPCRALLGWNGMRTDAECSLYGSISKHADAVIWKDTYTVRADDVLMAASGHAVARCDGNGKLPARHHGSRTHGIGYVFVAGIDMDACVLATCLSLFDAASTARRFLLLFWRYDGTRERLFTLRRQIGEERHIRRRHVGAMTS